MLIKTNKLQILNYIYLFALIVMPVCCSCANDDNVNTVFPNVFIDFYPRPGFDADDPGIHIVDGETITFTDFDPMASLIRPDGRDDWDKKSDVGILLLSNTKHAPFSLQINMTSDTLDSQNFVLYLPSVAYYRNTTPPTPLAGIQHRGEKWYAFWESPHTIYVADSDFLATVPWGTLIHLSFGLIPSGKFSTSPEDVICDGNPIGPGEHSVEITYTLINKNGKFISSQNQAVLIRGKR